MRALPFNEVYRFVLHEQQVRSCHVAAIWRAESFRASEGQPMTIRRAAALNAVLAVCDLPLLPGELLLGSGLGRLAHTVDAAVLQEAEMVLAHIGGRHFSIGYDHLAPDYAQLLAEGVEGLQARTEESLAAQAVPACRVFLQSVLLALNGAAHFIRRWADAAGDIAPDVPAWAELLGVQAAMLRRLANEPPRTLWEALQLILLFHSIFQLDDRGAMALGRLDILLFPYYQADIAMGRLTREDAQTLVDHFIAKLAHHTDIQNICLGGVTRTGDDATNDLSVICLEAVQRIGQPGANITVRVHADTPEVFLRQCGEVARTGAGFPAVVNDAVIIPALVAQGYPLEEARDYCFVGCIETFIPGRQGPWSDSRFNLLRCINLTLWGGYDVVAEKQCGPHTGEPETWNDFYAAFQTQVREGIRLHIEALNTLKSDADVHADELTSPLMSALVADCLARGQDVCAGGARYPSNHGVANMGIGCTADALMAIKRFLYDDSCFSLAGMRCMLRANFTGYEQERRLLLTGAPKYGNDIVEVDELAAAVAELVGQECLHYRTPTGGQYWSLLAANVQNVSAGREVGATPDGRLAFEPLSDAASPTFGRDIHGPTAVVRSVSRINYHWHPGGNVVNLKLHPSALAGEAGSAAFAALVRTCFTLGGVEMQFNICDQATLADAIAHPNRHHDLVVRVSGFSAYFTSLDAGVQQDILQRTAHVW